MSRAGMIDDPVPGGRPGQVARASGLAEVLMARSPAIEGVVLSWVDTAGITRIKAIPIRKLETVTAWGAGMSPVFDTFLADDSIVSTDVLGGPAGDLRLIPDLDGLVSLAAQPGWAWVPVDRITQAGESHPACTRTVLRRLTRRAAEAGISIKAGIEIEFALGRDDVEPGSFVPAVSGPAYGMTRLVEVSDFAAAVLSALAAQGCEVEQIHPEYAPGQFEVSVGALAPVAAADRSVLVRQTIRALAAKHGLRVSFAPSVIAGSVGNGGHVHLSAWRDEVNLHSGGKGRYGLTPDGEAFTAGILALLPELAALTTPSPASFLRLQPSHWAGVFACWGRENREAAVRLITGMTADPRAPANVEVKCADLAANPYLLLAGLLVAGLDGVKQGLTLPAEVPGDPAGLPESELDRLGIHRLPTNLAEAVELFSASSLLREELGKVLCDAVIAVRRGEDARMAGLDGDEIAAAYRWVY
jgi:glutamine synthetase